MFPDALINRINAAIAGVADTEAAPTCSAQQQPLKQAKALARRPCEDFPVGPVRLQTLAVGEELFPTDIAWVMIGYGDTPLVLRHATHLCAYLPIGRDMLAGLESSEHIGAGVCGIGQYADHARMVSRPQISLPSQAPPH